MSSDTALKALVQLRKGPQSPVGEARIRLLETIAETGSISAAAKRLGLSYKGAWDAVQALNNLFERPLIVTRPGGRTGGAAQITPAGEAVVTAFKQVENELSQVIARLEHQLASPEAPLGLVLRSLTMKTSARNLFRGVVTAVKTGEVNASVTLRIADDIAITAIVTRESLLELDLAVGREALAMIKSSFIILVPGDDPPRTSARNTLPGVVVRHQTGAVSDEVTLDLGGGKTLTATVTRESGETLGFKAGDRASALIKASHVILAVE